MYLHNTNKKREAEDLIRVEGLNEQCAKRYIQTSLKHGYASENGNDLNEALPKMSPLNPQYRTKKTNRLPKKSVVLLKNLKVLVGNFNSCFN